MAVVPIKFRCYQCNQLLGVSRSKAGTIVACPKCSKELIVPVPEESGGSPSIDLARNVTPDLYATSLAINPTDEMESSTLGTGPEIDILSLRPEDIRVVPGLHTAPPMPSINAHQTSRTDEPSEPENPDSEPASYETIYEQPTIKPQPSTHTVPPQRPKTTTIDLVKTTDQAPPEFDIPPIRVDPNATAAKPKRQIPDLRGRDLVLPRSVVAFWSLFVLLSLVFAFFAGLLAGHYVWRVH